MLFTCVNLFFSFLHDFTLLFVRNLSFKILSSFYKPRDSFPFDQQFNILMRFIVDQTQTPNLKVSNFVIIVQPLEFKFA